MSHSCKVGDEFGPMEYPIDRAMLQRYAVASGDHNPIHLDPEFAKKVGLPDTIAHGMLTMGLTASALHSWFSHCDAVTEFGARFVKPVVVPDAGTTLSVSAKVIDDLGDGRCVVDVTALAGGVKVLSMARAIVSCESA